jgi:peptidoglycan/LPS O-acetylase OafA/YrhL
MILSLEGLRGIAALSVALYHFGLPWAGSFPPLGVGWLWVDFFFVLSGAVMAHTYGGKLSQPGDLRAFLVKRFARLYPLHVLTLVVFVFLTVSAAYIAPLIKAALGREHVLPSMLSLISSFFSKEAWAIVLNLLLVQGMNTVDHMSLNFPSWSISVEFWTYLVFAIVAMTVRGSFRFVLLCLVISVICLAYLAIWGGRKDLGYMFDQGFIRCIAGFFLGCTIPAISANYFRGLDRFALGLLAWISLSLLYLIFALTPSMPIISFVCPMCAMLVVMVCYRGANWLDSLLSHRFMVKLGALSFGIYMWHVPLLIFFKPLRSGVPEGLVTVVAVVFVVLLLFLSEISWKYFESPWRKRISKLSVSRL